MPTGLLGRGGQSRSVAAWRADQGSCPERRREQDPPDEPLNQGAPAGDRRQLEILSGPLHAVALRPAARDLESDGVRIDRRQTPRLLRVARPAIACDVHRHLVVSYGEAHLEHLIAKDREYIAEHGILLLGSWSLLTGQRGLDVGHRDRIVDVRAIRDWWRDRGHRDANGQRAADPGRSFRGRSGRSRWSCVAGLIAVGTRRIGWGSTSACTARPDAHIVGAFVVLRTRLRSCSRVSSRLLQRRSSLTGLDLIEQRVRDVFAGSSAAPGQLAIGLILGVALLAAAALFYAMLVMAPRELAAPEPQPGVWLAIGSCSFSLTAVIAAGGWLLL